MSLEWSKQLKCSVYLILFLIKGGETQQSMSGSRTVDKGASKSLQQLEHPVCSQGGGWGGGRSSDQEAPGITQLVTDTAKRKMHQGESTHN